MARLDPASVLIVGASAAGTATATALRRRGHPGTIALLGDEPHLPYDRPPLSKHLLAGTWEADRLRLMPDERLAELDLDLRLGVTASSLDPIERVVVDERGREHPFDDLVIATGMRARTLPHLEAAGALVLRTVDDARHLRGLIRPGVRVVVVGAGFLGLESAATARSLGATVTVVEPMSSPLANRIGPETADRLLALHRRQGVEVLTGTLVAAAERKRGETVLQLDTGAALQADVVLVAIGASPCTEWLSGSGVTIDDGVVCDEYSRAATHVWAAGDVARWRHLRYGRDLRVEHRTNATEQGQHVAAGILGELAPYQPVPFFWTDHFDVKIQVAGQIGQFGAETDVPIDRVDAYVRLYHEDDQLCGVLGWNAPREFNAYRRDLLVSMKRDEVIA
jgi:NADPH-dependent 2,4-dienoyl-CoA reductase/sulfur reductase-like enzyme